MLITASVVGFIALLIGGTSYYQANHFNSQVTINDTKIGGLTAEQTLKKLKTSELENKGFYCKVFLMKLTVEKI
ncbi:hypothetical protein BK708_29200 [Bacillus thuringiensis serovar yunnanensis]|nr:hypothetical protein BK708_29200 [Bacillus thuringiensis serovar yunnanensis]